MYPLTFLFDKYVCSLIYLSYACHKKWFCLREGWFLCSLWSGTCEIICRFLRVDPFSYLLKVSNIIFFGIFGFLRLFSFLACYFFFSEKEKNKWRRFHRWREKKLQPMWRTRSPPNRKPEESKENKWENIEVLVK